MKSPEYFRAVAGSLAETLRRQEELGHDVVSREDARALDAALRALLEPPSTAPDGVTPAKPAPSRPSPSPRRRPEPPAPAERGSAPPRRARPTPQRANGERPPWARGEAPSKGIGSPALAAICEELGDCTRCGLSERRTNVVFGVGNPDARLLFIGEAPGRDEDRRGEPFVGAAGQLLTKMIVAMGLSRDAVYIANVVKCRPPGNRDPKPDEVQTCRPFLDRQIDAIQPEAIVTLGRIAAAELLGRSVSITRERGTWVSYRDVPVMPTLHPAYLLRNPDAKRDVWTDLQAVMARLGLSRS